MAIAPQPPPFSRRYLRGLIFLITALSQPVFAVGGGGGTDGTGGGGAFLCWTDENVAQRFSPYEPDTASIQSAEHISSLDLIHPWQAAGRLSGPATWYSISPETWRDIWTRPKLKTVTFEDALKQAFATLHKINPLAEKLLKRIAEANPVHSWRDRGNELDVTTDDFQSVQSRFYYRPDVLPEVKSIVYPWVKNSEGKQFYCRVAQVAYRIKEKATLAAHALSVTHIDYNRRIFDRFSGIDQAALALHEWSYILRDTLMDLMDEIDAKLPSKTRASPLDSLSEITRSSATIRVFVYLLMHHAYEIRTLHQYLPPTISYAYDPEFLTAYLDKDWASSQSWSLMISGLKLPNRPSYISQQREWSADFFSGSLLGPSVLAVENYWRNLAAIDALSEKDATWLLGQSVNAMARYESAFWGSMRNPKPQTAQAIFLALIASTPGAMNDVNPCVWIDRVPAKLSEHSAFKAIKATAELTSLEKLIAKAKAHCQDLAK